MIKDKNYKYVIGFVLGIIIFGGSVYASIRYSANLFYYDNNDSTLNSSNVQGAIDELAAKYDSLLTCPSDKVCVQKKSTLSLGDYLLYEPIKKSFSTDTTYTGYASTQIFKPSELFLWRVLSINQDGTVDIISEYVSSTKLYFKGSTGYKNLVGYLNFLASQYETSGITVGSRHFGYSNQTEYITDDTYFVNTAPWLCSTGGNCTPNPGNYEASGGGDTGYLNDYDLVNAVLGTGIAIKAGSSTAESYWIASRYYYYYNTSNYNWRGRYVTASGGISDYKLYGYSSGSLSSSSYYYSLRPIVTLSSTLTYSGVGNKYFPMKIIE